MTSCDTTWKIENKSKQFWFRRFLAKDQHNTNLVKELADFQESNESTGEIESFICRGYLYRSNKKDAQKKVYETAVLNVTRYSLFTKSSLKEKSYHQPRMHSNIISLVLIFNFQFGALHVILESIILIHCIMVGN